MAFIVNLTAHKATPPQIKAGVFDLIGERRIKRKVRKLLTFEYMPAPGELEIRAEKIALIASDQLNAHAYGGRAAMIGGRPSYMMAPLADALEKLNIVAVFAFSERRIVETVDSLDGSVRKRAVFRHAGFIWAV